MYMENAVVREDIEFICNDNNISWNQLKGKTVLVTGATGLIGKLVVKALSVKGGIKVVAVVRNREKAEKLFEGYENVYIKVCDIKELCDIDGDVDYIIHCASITDSKMFVNQPVDTFMTALKGTENILQLGIKKKCKGIVYTSSMEVYGTPQNDEKIDEAHSTNLDCMNVRACYPESKRACENLCCAYAAQYGARIMTARLTQTFGAGVAYNDGRVFAEFARCAVEGRDIILHTKGETKRSYLYTADAVRALLAIMLRGETCHAYNVANEESYCSIYEMAELVADKNSVNKINVRCEPEDISKFGYAAHLNMNLDTTAVKALGWQPVYSLENMFSRLVTYWNDEERLLT